MELYIKLYIFHLICSSIYFIHDKLIKLCKCMLIHIKVNYFGIKSEKKNLK